MDEQAVIIPVPEHFGCECNLFICQNVHRQAGEILARFTVAVIFLQIRMCPVIIEKTTYFIIYIYEAHAGALNCVIDNSR